MVTSRLINNFFVGSSGRDPSIDFLRALAIILVLMRHFVDRNKNYDPFLPDSVSYVGVIGWTGVDLFYVLSGFLIFSIIFKQEALGSFSWKIFYLKRSLRIWPAYFTSLVLSVLVGLFDINWKDIFYFFSFLQNYAGPLSDWNGGVYWSIAVEEHFYIIAPLLLVASTYTKKYRLHIILGLVILPLVLRYLIYIWIVNGDMSVFRTHINFPTHTRLDSLMWGVLCAHLLAAHRHIFDNPIVRLALPVITILLLVGALWSTEPLNQYVRRPSALSGSLGLTLTAAFWASVLMLGQVFRLFDTLGTGFMRVIAYLSFSMYLYHIFVLRFLKEYFETDTLTGEHVALHAVVYVILTLMAGFLSYALVERGFLVLKQKLVGTHLGHATARLSEVPPASTQAK